MDLLFPKDNSFKKVFKDTLGFVDADLPYVMLRADLRTATNTLIETIGKDTYGDIVTLYKDEENAADDLVTDAQYAIATLAYRMFAPSNDLQHGPNGRKMLTDEHSKTPFEHLLVKSNDELDRRSFRAMDDLLKHLDNSSESWKASDEYKASHALFVRTIKDFNKHYVINSRYLLQTLQPGLQMAERNNIIPRVGADNVKELKAKLNGDNDTALTASEATLIELIKEACVYLSLSWSIPRLQATLFPEGLTKQIRGDRSTISARVATTGNIVDQISQLYMQDAERVLLKIEAHVAPLVDDVNTSSTMADNNHNPNDNFVTT